MFQNKVVVFVVYHIAVVVDCDRITKTQRVCKTKIIGFIGTEVKNRKVFVCRVDEFGGKQGGYKGAHFLIFLI